VHLRRRELVRVAAVDAHAHRIARLDPGGLILVDEVAGEDLLGHGHRPRRGVTRRHRHVAAGERLGEREQPAGLDDLPGQWVPSRA